MLYVCLPLIKSLYEATPPISNQKRTKSGFAVSIRVNPSTSIKTEKISKNHINVRDIFFNPPKRIALYLNDFLFEL
jgi:hypothetical protein